MMTEHPDQTSTVSTREHRLAGRAWVGVFLVFVAVLSESVNLVQSVIMQEGSAYFAGRVMGIVVAGLVTVILPSVMVGLILSGIRWARWPLAAAALIAVILPVVSLLSGGVPPVLTVILAIGLAIGTATLWVPRTGQ